MSHIIYICSVLFEQINDYPGEPVSQKRKTRKVKQSGFAGARGSEWQWYQLGHMQITSPQTDNHASILPISFLQTGSPSPPTKRQSTEGHRWTKIQDRFL